ncbi:hypothetical protein PHYSODRAFT_389277, partial [Phytophthora sojae]
MKIKQQRVTGATAGTGERDLEDLLLKTQGGLVLLRELHSRREEQWKTVLEHYGYEHSSLKTASSETQEHGPEPPPPQQQVARQPQWLQTLASKLLALNQQVAATSHCALKRSQLTLSPVLVKQRAQALETHHRLLHAVDSASSAPDSIVTVDDVNKLLQFNYLKHQQAVVLERFCTRLKWLPVSHRFHLRQRMLALIHQQKVKNTPRPSASTAYNNSKDHIHCPLFMMSTSHFMAELKTLALNAFPLDSSINLDATLELDLESVVHAYTRNSRWELIQRGYLSNCEPSPGGIEETLIALRNDHKIDSLLANEWELLGLDDVGYLRVRLEALSRAHMKRAKVDPKSGPPHAWNPDALYSLYVLRVSSCRTKRLSLLRLLNYLHFVQLRQTTKEDLDDEDDDNYNGPQEFIFAAARRDFEVLELQMLRIASIFIFKQEYDSLPTSPRRRKNGTDQDSDSVVTTIERLQVLRDVYDCEVAFQQAKVQLVERLLEFGLDFAPRARDFSELNLTPPGDEPEPFTAILSPLLQRRPLIDFSHAYFFESYAAETLLLELQASLIQQVAQHFQRLEWCALKEFAFSDESNEEDDKRQWVCRQILGSRALVQLYAHQEELVRQTDEKWFTGTSIGDFHSLQHVLLEHTLVIWSLITKLELPGRPVNCLERTAGDLLLGSGWQLVLPPQLLSDVCRTIHEQPSASRPLVECLARAIELDAWRQKLTRSVYEAHLLELVHRFQFGFVKQIAAFDTVVGGEQARHLPFFFDFGDCDRTKSLQPIAVELETPMFHATSASKLAALPKHSEAWRTSLLSLQEQYVAYMTVIVSYQDAVGADVYEFAASYPYVCLANSLTPESSSSSDENLTLAMDINTVRTKYAKEISDKMTEEMRTSCFPYWKRLENLKQQLQER